MATVTELIPANILHRFLRQRQGWKHLVVAVSGPHAFGYPHPQSALELKGLHVEPTENLLGLKTPPKTFNWIGEYHGYRIDYSTCEIGLGLKRLLKGNGSMLERIMAPRQLLPGEDVRQLQKVTRGVVCRSFYFYYRNFSKGILRDFEDDEPRTVRHLLGAYRLGLTGVHLLLCGKVVLDLKDLARRYGFMQIEELIGLYQQDSAVILKDNNPAINRLAKLHALLEKALEQSTLNASPDNPSGIEEYLIDMRRRFFDAPTIQQE